MENANKQNMTKTSRKLDSWEVIMTTSSKVIKYSAVLAVLAALVNIGAGFMLDIRESKSSHYHKK